MRPLPEVPLGILLPMACVSGCTCTHLRTSYILSMHGYTCVHLATTKVIAGPHLVHSWTIAGPQPGHTWTTARLQLGHTWITAGPEMGHTRTTTGPQLGHTWTKAGPNMNHTCSTLGSTKQPLCGCRAEAAMRVSAASFLKYFPAPASHPEPSRTPKEWAMLWGSHQTPALCALPRCGSGPECPRWK